LSNKSRTNHPGNVYTHENGAVGTEKQRAKKRRWVPKISKRGAAKRRQMRKTALKAKERRGNASASTKTYLAYALSACINICSPAYQRINAN
jgi:hypothetical protein